MTTNLLAQIRRTSVNALQKGTLFPIETTCETLPASSSSPPFLLRNLANLRRKQDAGKAKTTKNENPFLPYDETLYVRHLPPEHVLLLNKFNVLPDHVLIVTDHFQEQSSLLTASDFTALWDVLSQVGGLSFYNAGTIAGASQRHKHLQVVIGDLGDMCPFDHLISNTVSSDGVFTVSEFPFVHAAVRVDDVSGDCGSALMEKYVQLLRCVEKEGIVGGGAKPFAYNLIATKVWMMVVPRREEKFDGISVNSLGFTGCLLVKNDEEMQVVKGVGGMHVLLKTGFERNGM